MLSQKNKSNSYIYEEEIDQENNEKTSLKNESIVIFNYQHRWSKLKLKSILRII